MNIHQVSLRHEFEKSLTCMHLSTSITALGQYIDPKVADLWRKFQLSIKN